MPGLAARLRKEGWQAQRLGRGNHITRLCHWVAAVSSGLWLPGLGGHPFLAFVGRRLGLWWAFRLSENLAEPGRRSPPSTQRRRA